MCSRSLANFYLLISWTPSRHSYPGDWERFKQGVFLSAILLHWLILLLHLLLLVLALIPSLLPALVHLLNEKTYLSHLSHFISWSAYPWSICSNLNPPFYYLVDLGSWQYCTHLSNLLALGSLGSSLFGGHLCWSCWWALVFGPLRLCEYYKQALKVTKLLVVLVPATELMLLMKIVVWLVVNIAAEQTRTHVVEPVLRVACLSPPPSRQHHPSRAALIALLTSRKWHLALIKTFGDTNIVKFLSLVSKLMSDDTGIGMVKIILKLSGH